MKSDWGTHRKGANHLPLNLRHGIKTLRFHSWAYSVLSYWRQISQVHSWPLSPVRRTTGTERPESNLSFVEVGASEASCFYA